MLDCFCRRLKGLELLVVGCSRARPFLELCSASSFLLSSLVLD